MRFAFAGDRQISVNILKFLLELGYEPKALLLSKGKKQSHANKLKSLVQIEDNLIFEGKEFKSNENIEQLKALDLDYIFGIHFPYIIPTELLKIPKIGFLNLHPAYLPYNKGWNTPSWAIIDGTPYGATLHFMSEKLDEGDIIHQKRLLVKKSDTANSLYQQVLDLEEEVFKEAIEQLVSLKLNRKKQTKQGTSYVKNDLQRMQEVNLNEKIKVTDFLDRLRGLSTNNKEEAAFFFENGKKIGMKIEFFEMEN